MLAGCTQLSGTSVPSTSRINTPGPWSKPQHDAVHRKGRTPVPGQNRSMTLSTERGALQQFVVPCQVPATRSPVWLRGNPLTREDLIVSRRSRPPPQYPHERVQEGFKLMVDRASLVGAKCVARVEHAE